MNFENYISKIIVRIIIFKKTFDVLDNPDNDLPALLTRAELSTRQIAEEARLRRGTGMDRIPTDSDRTVSNPPPSPVTDDPDHSEHTEQLSHGRRIQCYNDNILDIHGDSMDLF